MDAASPRQAAGRLHALARQGALSPAALARARQLCGLSPAAHQWRHFLARSLLLGGALLAGSGVIFFVAFNWADLPRMAKFALVAAAMGTAALVGWQHGGRGMAGQAALLLAQLLLGALLALFGQTYQTGADPYQLFLVWGVLALPWTVASGATGAWVLEWLLAQLAIVLYFIELRLGSLLFSGQWQILGALAVFNTAVLAATDLLPQRLGMSPRRLLLRLAGMVLSSVLALLMLIAIVGEHRDPASALHGAALGAAALTALLLVRYGQGRRDLFVAAWACLAAIAALEALLVRMLFYRNVDGPGEFLLAGLALIAMSAGAAAWLRRLQASTPIEETTP